MTARVFLVHAPRVGVHAKNIDLGPAGEFGTVTPILAAGDHPGLTPITACKKISAVLADFIPDEDYLLWTGGDPVGLVLVTGHILALGHKRIRWLRFSRKLDPVTKLRTQEPEYHPTWIDLPL